MGEGSTTRRAMLLSVIGASLLDSWPLSLAAKTLESSNPVATATGKVRGRRGRGVSAFLGIPYGADTLSLIHI